MNNKTKGAIAGVAGVALLAGGSTFALWSQTADAPAGTITAGNLQVAALNEPGTWIDTTNDSRIPITDLDEFRIVPGDTIERTFEIDAALEGTNMLANLTLTLSGAQVESFDDLLPGLDLTYTVHAGAEELATGDRTTLGELANVTLRSNDNRTPAGAGETSLSGELDDVADFIVVVTANFPSTTDERDYAQAKTDLQKLGVTLEQTPTP